MLSFHQIYTKQTLSNMKYIFGILILIMITTQSYGQASLKPKISDIDNILPAGRGIISDQYPELTYPQNTTAEQGTDVTLVCKFPKEAQSCYWKKDGITYALSNTNSNPAVPHYTGNRLFGDCSIILPSVTILHDGFYMCGLPKPIGEIDEEFASDQIKVTILDKPSVPGIEYNGKIVIDGEIRVHEEEDNIIVKCIVKDGNPAAELQWYKEDGTEIIGNVIVTRNNATGLSTVTNEINVVKSVNNQHAVASCNATHVSYTNTGHMSSVTAILILEGPVEVVTLTFSNTSETTLRIKAGEEVIMICRVYAEPQPEYEWQLRSDSNAEWKTFGEAKPTQIAKDTGHYRCGARNNENLEQYYKHSNTLKLEVESPVTVVTAFFEDSSERNATFQPGSSVSMMCIADGFPGPYYLWLKENITAVWFPFETSPNITIVAQEGVYVCAAQNNDNDDYVKSNTLTITIGNLTVVKHPQNATVKLGENLILNCTFNGRVDTCTWNKDGSYFLAGNNGTVFIGDESKGDCTIFIQNIQLQQDGIYFCEAQGVKSDEAKVIVLQAPKSPVVIFANEEIPDNSIIYLPNGKWPVSCKAEDGKPVAEISWFQNLCVEEGSERIETNPENPKLTTVTSTINITLNENSSDVRLTCISKHPAYNTQGFEVISVNFRSLGPVKVATATVVNHFKNTVTLSHKENMELICFASGSTIADYQWERKDENEEQWKFLKSGPTIYMTAVAGTYRCKAENRLNNGNAIISNEITISL